MDPDADFADYAACSRCEHPAHRSGLIQNIVSTTSLAIRGVMALYKSGMWNSLKLFGRLYNVAV